MIQNKNLKIYRLAIYSIFSLFFLLYLFPIDFMMPHENLDPSWLYVMDYAFNKDFLFPSELLFTYGPFGNFHYPAVLYNEKILLLHNFLPVLFTLIVVISLRKILRDQKLSVLLISISGILIALTFSWRSDLQASNIFWFFLQFLLIFLVFNTKSKSDMLFTYLLVTIISFSGLIKFSYVPSAILIMLITDIFLFSSYKKISYFTIVYILAFILFYLFSGQELGAIGSFVSASWQIASGFAGSMQVTGSSSALALFLLLGGSSLINLLYFILKYKAYSILYVAMTTYLLLFVLFKAGFVRQDLHIMTAFGGLILLLSFLYSLNNKLPSKVFSFIMFFLLVISTFAALKNYQYRFLSKIKQVPHLLSENHYDNLNDKYKNAIYNIKIKHPLPKLKGTVDIYPWDQSYLLANGLDYHPRPIFQSYSVYTPDLIHRNKKSLYSNTAPEYILFTIKNIDGRHPGMMEGATWLDLMKLYDIVDTANEFYILKSTKRDKNYSLQTLANIETSWNTDIKVPSEDKIYINIKTNKTLIGKLFQLLYKAPIVYIDITYLDGHHEKKRIIPSIASEGFILSPKISSASDFFKFSIGKLPSDAARKVKSIKLINDNTFVYSKSIEVSFHNIDTTGFTMSDNVSPKLKKRIKQEAFYKNIIKDNSNVNKKMFSIVNYDDKKILFAHEGITFSVNSKIIQTEKNTSFKFGYGIKKGAYSGKNNVAGGCFDIYGLNDKDKQLLWHKCITPKQKKSDRGTLYDNFIIDNKFKTYEFSTAPIEGKPSAWGWTYWNFNGVDNESN